MNSKFEAAGDVVHSLFLLLKAAMNYADAQHPALVKVAEKLHENLGGLSGTFSLQFVAQAAFMDFELIPMDHEGFMRSRELFFALNNLGAHEFTFLAARPTVPILCRLGTIMARGAQGPSDELDELRLQGLSWRAIRHTAWGAETEDVDAEVFAIAQVALAVRETETLVGADVWDFSAGVGVARRIERALEVSGNGTERAVELAPTEWTVARRAVSATYTVLRSLERVDLTTSTRRAAAHAVLALACEGLSERGGAEPDEAASRALAAMEAAPERARTGVSPHRLKTTALVNGFREPNPARWLSLLHLVAVAYDLEVQRSPEGVDFQLTRGDLSGDGAFICRHLDETIDIGL